MKKVYAIADNVISPLGFSTVENFKAMLNGRTGIAKIATEVEQAPELYASAIPEAHLTTQWDLLLASQPYTRFEKLLILSIREALSHTNIDPASPETLFVFSTTKGNIELIDPTFQHAFDSARVHLWRSAQEVSGYFKNPNRSLVVSHACISGVSALITAKRYLENGVYKQAIVCGADVLSRFTIAGFNSLKALSPTYCRPYDARHEGLNLGEGAATVILTTEEPIASEAAIVLKSGVTSNDANHISGPSRTGEGLYRAIQKTMQGEDVSRLAFVNMHGTATVFNDDMESVAINRAGLQEVPVSGFKGYVGHTLGAAGIIETALSIEAMKNKLLPGTLGCKTPGTAEKINVTEQAVPLKKSCFLKTASGFGGCNAAILMEMEN